MFMQNFVKLSAAVHDNHELSCAQKQMMLTTILPSLPRAAVNRAADLSSVGLEGGILL